MPKQAHVWIPSLTIAHPPHAVQKSRAGTCRICPLVFRYTSLHIFDSASEAVGKSRASHDLWHASSTLACVSRRCNYATRMSSIACSLIWAVDLWTRWSVPVRCDTDERQENVAIEWLSLEPHVLLKFSAWRLPLFLQWLRAPASARVRTHARSRVGQISAKAEARLRTHRHTRTSAALGVGRPRDRKPLCCKWRAIVLLPKVQHAADVKTLYAKLTCHLYKRGEGKWNSCGQCPVDVELISLAA